MGVAANVGAISLGLFVGYLVWHFVSKFSAFTVSGLTSILGAVLAGAVLKYLAKEENAQVFVFYPIGLVLGAMLFGTWPWFKQLMDQEVHDELNRRLLKSSGYRKCSKRRILILGHSVQATSWLRIGDTIRRSPTARGLSSGSSSGFAAALRLQ
jgi:hypothetical protein